MQIKLPTSNERAQRLHTNRLLVELEHLKSEISLLEEKFDQVAHATNNAHIVELIFDGGETVKIRKAAR